MPAEVVETYEAYWTVDDIAFCGDGHVDAASSGRVRARHNDPGGTDFSESAVLGCALDRLDNVPSVLYVLRQQKTTRSGAHAHERRRCKGLPS